MNRRELLQLFGVGATIVPVVGGMSQELTRAIIIEPPKIEVAPPPKLIEATAADVAGLQRNEIVEITVFLRQKNPHKVYRMDCKGFVSSCKMQESDVTSYHSSGNYREFSYGMLETKLEIVVIDTPKLMESA